jgi:hypothetical protein
MDGAQPAGAPAVDAPAGDRYLLLADISGYTSFMASVEQAHGVDFSEGIPAAYAVLGGLLDGVIDGLEPDFDLVKLEGDAVFACAPAARLDRRGDHALERIRSMYRGFIANRTRAIPAADHTCTACPNVAYLDLKVVLHRGVTVRQTVGAGSDLLGPAVTVAHRLLKNRIRERIGFQPYLFVTEAAASGLGLPDVGVRHREDYPESPGVQGMILELGVPLRPTA